jgi:hypothetical protein
MKDDIAAVRQQMEHVISQGDEILLVLHSAGGFIGSEAMEGLSKHQRQRQGHNGGVIGIIFIAGAVFPKGHQHQPLPCAIVEVSDLFHSIDLSTIDPFIGRGFLLYTA